MANDELQQRLDRILDQLKSDDKALCFSALNDLGTLTASSPAILRTLENLALHDENEGIRRLAKELIGNSTHQFVRKSINRLPAEDRTLLIQHIEHWESDGLLGVEQAGIIKQRYNFDMAPPPAQPQPVTMVEEAKEPAAFTPPPTAPLAPSPTLMQTLLSESSIKVYLYLGAFFVIASALILAAVVEAARLPILGVATLAFGGGAFIIRKRLPQPGFALFIVFSFLLPIDANVLEETIHFGEPTLSVYWMIVFLCMALIWGFSLWFYESKFFSLVAFIALSLAFHRFGQIFQTEPELQILLGVLASLTGLAGISILKRWKDNRFVLPVFLLAQLQVLALLLVSLVLAVIHVFDSDISNPWWLLIALTWITSASFFAASDILFPFFLFPWMAMATLLPLPLFFLNTFNVYQSFDAVGFWIWAAVLALASEAAQRVPVERLRKYHWPFLAGSLPLFGTAILIALDWDRQLLTFVLLTGTAVVYAAIHLLRPRWYVWSVALLAALSAYFVFFTLPFINRSHVPVLYQMLGASILLSLPELFVQKRLSSENQSRLPAVIFGLFVSLLTMSVALIDTTHAGRSAIVFLIFAILLTLYAFHFQRPWIGYFSSTMAVLTVVYALHHFHLDLWLPAVTLLSVIYYTTGFWLRRMAAHMKAWGLVLLNSGLVLGAILSMVTLALSEETAGRYIIVIALLFAVEIFARPLAWLEVIVEILLSLSLYMILNDLNVFYAFDHFLFGASLIWLGGDLVFSRFAKKAEKTERVEKRAHRPVTVAVGYIFLLASSVNLLSSSNANRSTLYFALYALFFVIYALTQHDPQLGYFAAAFVPLATVELWNVLNFEKWIFPLVGLAVLYYAIGFILRRSQAARRWDTTLLYSGLGLGVLTSIASPFQGGLDSSIPVALAATLFAVEAFALRNVWWAVPADALYLMSYFMILAELKVDEPQYYSIGAALLGMLMHYLLTRAGSKTGAFAAGMLSQLVLLGTTYIQMVSNNDLRFFFVLFAQSMVILIYGLILRSRSLVITPIAFAVLGVITVVYSALKGLSSVILIGCTGVVLLMLGIGAVILRERITKLGEQLSDWKP